MENKQSFKHIIIAIFSIIILVAIDQYTKYLAVLHLKGTDGIDIISGVFKLEYLENRGAAFGMLQGQQTFFLISTPIIIVILSYIYMCIPRIKHFLLIRICTVVIIAGAIGNLLDRARLNYVIDFFYFELIDFPIFNIADIYCTVTVAVFGVAILFYYKEEDLNDIKLWKK